MEVLFTIVISALTILPGATAVAVRPSLLLCDVCTQRGTMTIDSPCLEFDFSMPCYTYCHDEDIVLGRKQCCVCISQAFSCDNVLTSIDHFSVLALVVVRMERYTATSWFYVLVVILISVFLLVHLCLWNRV